MGTGSGIRTVGGRRRRTVVFAIACALALIALLGAAVAAAAVTTPTTDTHTWTGSGADRNWTTAGNWDIGAPGTGDSLIFPATPTGGVYVATNNFIAGTQFGNITIANSTYDFTGGNALALTGGITNTYGSSGNVTIPFNITLNGAQTFSTPNSGTIYVEGQLTGTSALTIGGTGIVGLKGHNTSFSGAVTVGDGTNTDVALDAWQTDALGTGSVTVRTACSLRTAAAGTFTNALTINGTGRSGGGALQNMSGALVWSGLITLGSDAKMTSWGTSIEISSIADSTYKLTTAGAGPVIVSGTPAFTGGFVAMSGTLRITGTLPSTCGVEGYANQTATLDGTGTAGPVTIKSRNTLAPGVGGPGRLTTAGLTLLSGGTFSAQVNGTTAATEYDQVASSGAVSLGGSTLSVSVGYTPAIGDHYTLIDNTSGSAVTGTFSGLAEGGFLTVGGKTYQISYAGGTGDDVVLTRAHQPTTFTITAGSHQSTALNTAFATALKARVLDEDNNPLSGVSVTFTAPGSGASGTFASSSTVTTDGDGYATAPTFTANTTLGSYNVTASTAGLTDLDFALRNTVGNPSVITVAAGDPQSAQVGAAFATRLKVLVKDAWDNAVPGATVLFEAPGSGASGTFAGSSAVTSDDSGYAEAPVFTANGTSGAYTVTAGSMGVATPASFHLTNTGEAPAITSAAAATFTAGAPGTFTVTTTGTPKAALAETGALPAGVTFVDKGDGTATLAGTPAAGTVGDYPISIAATNGIGSGATQAFVLHVTAAVPPVTTVHGVPSGWSRRSVRLTFTAEPGAGGSPVDYTEYRVGSGKWVRGTSVTVSRAGVTKVAYRSVSTTGGVEASQTCTVRIDAGVPVVRNSGNPVCWQGGLARFSYRLSRTGAPVRATLVITRYGWHARTIELGSVPTGKRLVAIVRLDLPVGTWNWRIVVHTAQGARAAGHQRRLMVYPR